MRVRWIFAVGALLLAFGFGVPSSFAQTDRLGPSSKPNIVFVMADDLNERMMGRLPGLRSLTASKGVSFENAFVTHSLCCPSRASILTGKYTHNHRVRTNKAPEGGVEAFEREGNNASNVVRWLDGEGYRTVFVGKYLNGYKGGYTPPGWDRWYGYEGVYQNRQHRIYVGHKDRTLSYDADQHHDTDLFRNFALEEIRRSAQSNAPLYLNIWTNAPHSPALAPERHKNEFRDAALPKPPSYNEDDVSDKPSWVRQRAPFDAREEDRATKLHRARLRSMLSVEDLLRETLHTLRDQGELDNTYVVFTSDNGFHLGEHAIDRDKQTAYEEDIGVPLYVRGPGVPAGETRDQLALNTDLAPTFADLAGVRAPGKVDGRSLAPLLRKTTPGDWRSAFLIENYRDEGGFAPYIPGYRAVRTGNRLYVEYETGEKELYDLSEDPYELQNLAGERPEEQAALEERLEALKGCSASSCRRAEDRVSVPAATTGR